MLHNRLLFLLAAFIPVLFLCGCGSTAILEPKDNLVFIEEGWGYTVVNNGQQIPANVDAEFVFQMKPGLHIASCDYPGRYLVSSKGLTTYLKLEGIAFPTRVRVFLSGQNCSIKYEPNGGSLINGIVEPVTVSYSLMPHLRPNTERGADMFIRDGYTIVSWNSAPDGSGTTIGLGSRVTNLSGELTLYAQWEKWSPQDDFLWVEQDDNIHITGYSGNSDKIVIPFLISGKPVRTIDTGAFTDCIAKSVILPHSLDVLQEGAFNNCDFTELTMFDNLNNFSDLSFINCTKFRTLHINALESPFGYIYRKESCYADKLDLLIMAHGQKKIVFYGGCSMWYNLDGSLANSKLGHNYRIINVALNGTVSSAVQLQIMAPYLENGDILFHTPELSSKPQLMLRTDMTSNDTALWCGIENNYDLFSAVDLRTIDGVFDSFHEYLSMKNRRTDYNRFFSADFKTPFWDGYGCIPFYRSISSSVLGDKVFVSPEMFTPEKLSTLQSYYSWLRNNGVNIYTSYACLNVDALPDGQLETLSETQRLFSEQMNKFTGHPVIGIPEDFIYSTADFYDTNYHLLSEPAKLNTEMWLNALVHQLIADGLIQEA